MENRRDTLKIIGAIGATCAFPFSADELYGQHVHQPPVAPAEAGPFTPKFFGPEEFKTLSRLTDVIIPATDTPGATGAGVPQYIDGVVNANAGHQKRFRSGLAWLDRESSRRFGRKFVQISEEQALELLSPLCQAVDSGEPNSESEHFFRLVKNLTADGYYTSQPGLVKELGYTGNTVLDKFPQCEIPEH